MAHIPHATDAGDLPGHRDVIEYAALAQALTLDLDGLADVVGAEFAVTEDGLGNNLPDFHAGQAAEIG